MRRPVRMNTPTEIVRRESANLSERTDAAMRDMLDGRRRGVLGWLAFAGPAVIASVAYVDPGNFVTNLQAGAGYGDRLLWVVVIANVVAMLFQALSARLGIVTGRNLAELSRARFGRPIAIAMWIAAEIGAIATDLAEFVGGAIGLSLLAGIGLLAGMGIVAVLSIALLALRRRGFRPFELVIGVLVGLIGLSYVVQLGLIRVDWPRAIHGALVPGLPDRAALALAIGMIGATVMPHAIYLHSGLTQSRLRPREAAECRRLIRISNAEVVIALGLTGLVNMAMVLAAGAFHPDHPQIADLSEAYRSLTPLLGGLAAAAFLTALLASGLSSTVVGTLAGDMVMAGFTGRRLKLWVRRVVTMAPAFLIIASGVDATRALVVSQIVLSFVLPVPMIALLVISADRTLLGGFALSARALWLPAMAVAVITLLNLILVVGGIADLAHLSRA